RSVLIVEDNSDSLSLMQVILKREGFDVLTAGDGKAALKLLTSFSPDAIVTDWMMPEMTGIELINTARQLTHCSKIPIILLSAYSLTIYAEAIAAGATVVLEKPDGTLDLPATLTKLLGE